MKIIIADLDQSTEPENATRVIYLPFVHLGNEKITLKDPLEG